MRESRVSVTAKFRKLVANVPQVGALGLPALATRGRGARAAAACVSAAPRHGAMTHNARRSRAAMQFQPLFYFNSNIYKKLIVRGN